MFEVKETSPSTELRNSHTVVGTTPTQLTNLSYKFVRGIIIRAPGPNDDNPNVAIVYVGGSSVTADYSATGGVPLPPGSSLELPVDDPSQVYVVVAAGVSPQDVAWMGV